MGEWSQCPYGSSHSGNVKCVPSSSAFSSIVNLEGLVAISKSTPFSIATNLPSMNLTGYIEFAVLIDVKISSDQKIVEKTHYELQEYLLHIPHRYQKECVCI